MRPQAIIVLGHRLNEDCSPSEDLKQRIDRTVEYWKETGITPIMPCGGLTRGRARTEAEVMREMLLERGVPEDAIRLENESRTTGENIRNAVRLLGEGASVALVTSDYHIEASIAECEHYGLAAVPVPAITPDEAYREEQYRICRTFSRMNAYLRAEAQLQGLSEEEARERHFIQMNTEREAAKRNGITEDEFMRRHMMEIMKKIESMGL